MATFNRKQFKPTNLSVLAKQKEEGEKFSQNNDRPGFLSIEKGTNKFRLFPSHEEDGSFKVMKAVHFVPEMVEDKKTKKVELKKVPVFNARVHGNQEYDIVEQYVEFAKKMIPIKFAKDEAKQVELLAFIKHFKTGMNINIKWVMYALKIKGTAKTFGRLEVPVSCDARIQDLTITESSDESIQLDPFTDVDDGKAIIIIFDDLADPKDKYKATLEWKGDYKLTDEELKVWYESDSLDKMFKNTYSKSDFQKALNGVTLYDQQNKINITDTNEWKDFVADFATTIPADKKDEDVKKDKKVTSNTNTKPALKEEDDEVQEIDEVDASIPQEVYDEMIEAVDEMDRKELKAFIKEQELDITVYTKTTDDELKTLIKQALELKLEKDQELEKDEVDDKDEEFQDDLDKTFATPPAGSKKSSDFRKKLGKKD